MTLRDQCDVVNVACYFADNSQLGADIQAGLQVIIKNISCGSVKVNYS